MSIKALKREWLAGQLATLHGQGLRDAAIARRLGVSRAYFSEATRAEHVSDALIERLCKEFDLQPPGVSQSPDTPPPPAPPSPGFARLQDSLERLIEAHTQLMANYSRCGEEVDRLRARVTELEGRLVR